MALASSDNAHANFNALAEQYTIVCADSKQTSVDALSPQFTFIDAVKGILHPQACAYSEYVCQVTLLCTQESAVTKAFLLNLQASRAKGSQ